MTVNEHAVRDLIHFARQRWQGEFTYTDDEVVKRWESGAFPYEKQQYSAPDFRMLRTFGAGLGLHYKTADLVYRFALALVQKLHAAEEKYGYSDGWASPDWMDECRQHLREHIEKGDPRDVAAYCAFLWHHGASTASPPLTAPAAPEAVGEVPTHEIVTCEDCDGAGVVGEEYSCGEFQPPERDRCTSCGGSGRWRVPLATPLKQEVAS